MEEKVLEIIKQSINEIAEEQGNTSFSKLAIDEPLYGIGGIIDSISLVRLIADVEEKIFEEFNKTITIADERAMSQRNSPFRSIQALTDYIILILKEDNE